MNKCILVPKAQKLGIVQKVQIRTNQQQEDEHNNPAEEGGGGDEGLFLTCSAQLVGFSLGRGGDREMGGERGVGQITPPSHTHAHSSFTNTHLHVRAHTCTLT